MSKPEQAINKEKEGSKIDERIDFYLKSDYYDNSGKYEELLGELETYVATLTSENPDKQAEFNKVLKTKIGYDNPTLLQTLGESFDGWSVEDIQKLLEGIKNSEEKFNTSYSQKESKQKEALAAIKAKIFLDGQLEEVIANDPEGYAKNK